MSTRPRAVLALAAVLLLASVAVALPVGGVPDARLTVSGVTVTPGTPVTDAPVTVSVTVSNAAGSPDAVEVDEVWLTDGDDVVARARNPGSLSAGGTLTVPLTTRFDEAGEKRLTVRVRGRDEDGERVDVRRPLSLVIEAAPPLVELETSTVVAGSDTLVPVVVSNPTTEPIRNLVVTVSTTNGEAVVARRTVAQLTAGAAQQLNFTLRAASAGDATVSTTVNYTTASGTRSVEQYEHRVSVDPLVDDVGVRITASPTAEQEPQQPGGQLGVLLGQSAGGGGSTTRDGSDEESRAVEVTVTNFGNAPISNIVATPTVGETQLPRVGVNGPLAPGASETVVVSLERAPPGELQVDVDYEITGEPSSASGTFDFRPQSGAVRLTGVDLSFEDDVVTITGNAGNVGEGSVTGLVVAVGTADGVQPAYPQRDFFVGTVEGSEFAPFELTARVDTANASSVPVVVSYTVDGESREDRVSFPLSDDVASAEQSDRSLPLSLSVWVGVGVAMAAATVVVVRRR